MAAVKPEDPCFRRHISPSRPPRLPWGVSQSELSFHSVWPSLQRAGGGGGGTLPVRSVIELFLDGGK